MPCTYCGDPKHTRKNCPNIEKDFNTYLEVSAAVRADYIERLTDKGIVPGAVVKTYNRTKNFMKTYSETPVEGLGDVDMFSCYSGPGKRDFAVASPTKEHIILADDDDRMVTIAHCYEIVEPSNNSWDPEWITKQLLSFDEFKTLFKGKKRHMGFEAEKIGCVVKKYTTEPRTIEDIIRDMNEEEEEVLTETSGAVFVVTVTDHTDDYKRKHTYTRTLTASTEEDAVGLAAFSYLERVSDYEVFYHNEELYNEFKTAMSDTGDPVNTAYKFFSANADELFAGEYVPTTFEVSISSETTSKIPEAQLTGLVSEIIEVMETN